jgi:PAS domain S-box-containing protein
MIAGLRVLVVDDSAVNRQLLQTFLTKLGCEVMLAEDGARAVAMFEQEAPDLIFMDVMMPEMDGYEATRRIKAAAGDRWVPVVFVSALDKDENLVAGLEAGGDDYLPKPVNFVLLHAKLRSLVRTLSLQRRFDEAHRFNEAVTDNIADCVVSIDERGIIRSVTAMAIVIFGYLSEELIGRNVSMLMPEPDRSAHDGYLRRYLDGGMPRIIGMPHRVVRGLRKDGGIFPLELTVTEMRFDGRRLFVGIMRDISERIAAEAVARQHAAALQRYHDEREAENALAGEIMQRLLQRRGLADPRAHYWLAPATDFSGDIGAAARAADGRLYAMLADATGHGLGAAISVLPVLTSFYSLVEHGFPLGYIAYELNRQLRDVMPAGRFVAANLVCFDESRQLAEVWLGGLPDLVVLKPDGSIARRLASMHPPLGIVDFDEEMAGIEKMTCPPGSQLALMSDGLIEAMAENGEPFSADGLARTFAGVAPDRRLQAIQDALKLHLGGRAPHDDVSIMLIDC